MKQKNVLLSLYLYLAIKLPLKTFFVVTLVYCKCGYFRLGTISRKCWQDLSHGGNFHDISPISLTKSYGFYFSAGGGGGVGSRRRKNNKNAKITPHANFSMLIVIKSAVIKLDRQSKAVTLSTCSAFGHSSSLAFQIKLDKTKFAHAQLHVDHIRNQMNPYSVGGYE